MPIQKKTKTYNVTLTTAVTVEAKDEEEAEVAAFLAINKEKTCGLLSVESIEETSEDE